MIRRIFRRVTREPLPCLAVLLFAAILTVILCYLHQAQRAEQESYDRTFHAIPVEFEITQRNGNRLDDSAQIKGYMADLFTADSLLEPNFADLVTDVQMRMSHSGTQSPADEESPAITRRMVGITSLRVAEELTPEFGGLIEWREGFGADVFSTADFVCIVPSAYPDADEVTLTFRYRADGASETRESTCRFAIVGRYTDEGNSKLYCPYAAMEGVYHTLGEPRYLHALMGTLANNDDLARLHETARCWFAEPDPLSASTLGEKSAFALDIRDALLLRLTEDMQSSMTLNRLAAAMVFVLSAGAGFLTGFLVIRARKQEIALMRTLGVPDCRVCMELGAEQAACVVAGVFIGGSYALWTPAEQLVLFAGIFLFGLTAALLVFIRANLLVSLKEDE